MLTCIQTQFNSKCTHVQALTHKRYKATPHRIPVGCGGAWSTFGFKLELWVTALFRHALSVLMNTPQIIPVLSGNDAIVVKNNRPTMKFSQFSASIKFSSAMTTMHELTAIFRRLGTHGCRAGEGFDIFSRILCSWCPAAVSNACVNIHLLLVLTF